MQIETLGSLGLGFVWGWLLGIYSRSAKDRRLGNWVVLLLATSLLALLTQRTGKRLPISTTKSKGTNHFKRLRISFFLP
jgi:hypothetical protein